MVNKIDKIIPTKAVIQRNLKKSIEYNECLGTTAVDLRFKVGGGWKLKVIS